MPTRERSYLEGQAVQRWIRPLFWLIAVVLGAIQPWEGWYTIAEDGLSYIEIGEAYSHGDWKNAINAYWGPLYSLILGGVLRTVDLPLYWESTVVHCINFMIYLCALGAFDFFACQLLRYHHEKSQTLAQQGLITFSADGWIILAFGLFIWTSLQWITLQEELADMLLSVFVYLATGIVLRIRMGAVGEGTFALLGAVLGLGYLTKSAMFPLAFIYLGVTWLSIRDRSNAMLRLLLALTVFLALASPYIVAVSLTKGRLTFGDSGKLNYIWFANGEETTQPHNWSRLFPNDDKPLHPTRKVFDTPPLYEFGSQIGGTYPPWYDPSYWHDGVVSHFELRGQLRAVKRSVKRLLWMAFEGAPFIVPGFFLCFYVAGRGSRCLSEIAEHWVLLVPSFAAVGMYTLVYLSPRYIAPFAVLLWIGVFSGVRLPNSRECRRLVLAVPISMLIIMGVLFWPQVWHQAYAAARGELLPQKHWVWEIADRLHQIGVQPGDRVAYVGYGASAYWAHLAQVQIVAEMFAERWDFSSVENVETMLFEDGSLKPEVIQAFASTGATAIIAQGVPLAVSRKGWQELGYSYYAYILPK